MFPRLFAVLLSATLIAGCGSPSPSFRSLDDFSSLKLADHSLVTTDSLPPAPKGFSDGDVETLAKKLMKIAELGTYNSDVWHPGSQVAAIDMVLKDLEPAVRRSLNRSALKQLDGRPWANLVGTVFADGVEVVGKPLIQRATWDVDVDEEGDETWLEVRLQTRTFYAIRHKGRQSVVAATRTWGLSSPSPVRDFYPVPSFAADPIGADPCAFILRSVLTPDTNEKHYAKDMMEVLRESPKKFVAPTGDHGEATAKACRAKES